MNAMDCLDTIRTTKAFRIPFSMRVPWEGEAPDLFVRFSSLVLLLLAELDRRDEVVFSPSSTGTSFTRALPLDRSRSVASALTLIGSSIVNHGGAIRAWSGACGEVMLTSGEQSSIRRADVFTIGSPDVEVALITSEGDGRGSRLTIEVSVRQAHYFPELGRMLVWHLKHFSAAIEKGVDAALQQFRWYSASDLRLLHQDVPVALRNEAPPSISDRLTAAFELHADRVAIQFEEGQLTYGQVRNAYLNVAARLRAAAVVPGDFVIVATGRGPEAIISILGALHVGAAFVPVDPSLPPERLYAMLSGLKPRVVCVHDGVTTPFDHWRCLGIGLEISGCKDTPAPAAWFPEHPACCFFTSGTTGQPKAALVPHRAVAAFVDGILPHLRLSEDDVILQVAPPGFDVLLEEVFPALCAGARLVTLRASPCGPGQELSSLLADFGVTVIELPTAYWNEWSRFLRSSSLELPPCLRLVLIGGDHVSPSAIDAWRGRRAKLLNVYGVTEAACTSAVHQIGENRYPDFFRGAPIGKALAHVDLQLLDEGLHPVAPLGVGELFIGGMGVALGYVGNEEATAASFVALDGQAQRLYRTGDTCRSLADGTLEFLGRSDRQVKLSGYRIELAEIEHAALAVDGVKAAAALLLDGTGRARSLGLFVASDSRDEAYVRRELEKRLPRYMLPRAIRVLPSLPRASTGKLNWQEMKSLLTTALPSHDAQGELEQKVSQLFSRCLGHDQFTRDDPFLEAGGDSAGLLGIVAELSVIVGRELSLVDIYTNQSVAGLVSLLTREHN